MTLPSTSLNIQTTQLPSPTNHLGGLIQITRLLQERASRRETSTDFCCPPGVMEVTYFKAFVKEFVSSICFLIITHPLSRVIPKTPITDLDHCGSYGIALFLFSLDFPVHSLFKPLFFLFVHSIEQGAFQPSFQCLYLLFYYVNAQ